MKFKIKFDDIFAATPSQRDKAHQRMARYGKWLGNGWWAPSPSQAARARERIEREGFVIELTGVDIITADHIHMEQMEQMAQKAYLGSAHQH